MLVTTYWTMWCRISNHIINIFTALIFHHIQILLSNLLLDFLYAVCRALRNCLHSPALQLLPLRMFCFSLLLYVLFFTHIWIWLDNTIITTSPTTVPLRLVTGTVFKNRKKYFTQGQWKWFVNSCVQIKYKILWDYKCGTWVMPFWKHESRR
jgi:hypothetical protein